MTSKFPWYEIVSDGSLQQGDIFSDFPVFLPEVSSKAVEDYVEGRPLPDIPIDPIKVSVIVVTQSCDLENKDVETVVLCPIWSATEMKSKFKWGTGKLNNVRKGREFPWHIIKESGSPKLESSIVEFQRIFTTTRQTLEIFDSKKGSHIRLLPPYRENFSQAFARYFMRIALPDEIPPF